MATCAPSGRALCRALALLLLVGAALPSASPARAAEPAPRADDASGEGGGGPRYALVVGVQRYNHANPLGYAVADAERIAATLEARGYTVSLMRDYEAEPDDILERLRTVADVMSGGGLDRRGTLVFAFSGHGFRQGDENYLATSRTDPDDIAGTALSMTRLKAELARSGARRRVLFIDACRNDPGKGVDMAERRFAFDDDAEGLAILYSTGAGELAWEDPELGHGVFSHFLAMGLAGAAADEDGQVTFDALHDYVRERVKEHVLKRYDRSQIPYIAGERSGRFVLTRVDGRADAPGPSSPSDGSAPANGLSELGDDSPSSNGGEARVGRSATEGGRPDWRIGAAVLGVVVLGILAAGARGSSGEDGAPPITLVVPTL